MTNIAVIGGTGAEGSGLAVRWAVAGHTVTIGSRDAAKAASSAAELNQTLPANSPPIRGATNADAASQADVILLSVPYSAQQGTIEQILEASRGKPVLTCVVPLKPPKVSVVWRPPGGSAAEEAQAQLGESTPVIAAFHNVSAGHLKDLSWQPECDVLVAGDQKEAKQLALQLVKDAGFVAIDIGALANSSVVEGLTAVLIGINIRNKVQGSGIRITGLTHG